MATLSEGDRQRIWRGLMRYWSNEREPTSGFGKDDLKDAVDATDDWIDANQGSFNNALPVLVRTNLTQAQKTLLFCVVALARVSIVFLRRVVGEVD
jgi:hypothetical protein